MKPSPTSSIKRRTILTTVSGITASTAFSRFATSEHERRSSDPLPLCALLFLIVALFASSVSAAVTLFPAPASLPPSPHYRVEVQTPGGWQTSFVNFNPARTDGVGSKDQPGRSMSWTTFHTDTPVRVRVTAPQWPAEGVVVRPARLGLAPEKTGGNTVEFTLEPGHKVSVEFPGSIKPDCFTGPPNGIPCVMHALLLFADRAPTNNPVTAYAAGDVATLAPGLHAELRPVANLPGRTAHRSTLGDAGGKRVVVFAPGVHDLGYWEVPNNVEHVHLEPGTVVFGALDVLPQGRAPGAFDVNTVYRDAWAKETLRAEFKLTGAGILSGAKLPWHLKKDFSYHQNDHWWQHVKLVQLPVEKITLRDVTLVDAPYWTVSFLNDADARSRGVFANFKIVGAWTYNNDGLPVPGGTGSIVRDAFIHADDDALKLYHSGGRVENCVVWQNNNGAVFQFGWFPKTVRDVRVRGVDVIHNENWYGVNQVNRAVFNYADAGGRGVIEDIHFEDIAIEGKVLRAFGFKAMGGQALRGWQFKNVSVGALGAGQLGGPGRNYFHGDISGFHFDGFTIGGKKITASEAAAFDFGPGAGDGFTFK